MRSVYLISAAFGLLCTNTSVKGQTAPEASEAKNGKNITIGFNKNIEFLGYALHMGEPEDEPSEATASHPLRQFLDARRRELKNDESLARIFELGAELPYSVFVELFAVIDELPGTRGTFVIPEEVMQRYQLNTPADAALLQEIMEQTKVFYEVSEFELFWESSQAWYEKALQEINNVKPADALIEAMERFYEQRFTSYKIIPSLTFWSGPGFGFKAEDEGSMIAYFVLGPLTDDYRFDLPDRMETLTVHEFGHSFVNHVLEETSADLIRETTSLFDPLAEAMGAQGYPTWANCIDEHFVRAGEVLIPELMGNKTMAQSNLKWNAEERKFIYLPFVVDQLRRYRIAEGLPYEECVKKTMVDLKKKFLP